VIESLHPFAIGVAVACLPVATIAVSASIDYLSRREHEQQSAIAPPPERGGIAPAPGQPRTPPALPAATRLSANERKA
jgi:hypothetical protein